MTFSLGMVYFGLLLNCLSELYNGLWLASISIFSIKAYISMSY